ncbi:MAG: cobalamin biosynthesis protein [Promethearchaeota archaeon]
MNFLVLNIYFPLITLLTVLFALLIDGIIGDPHVKYHPVNLMGNLFILFKNLVMKVQNPLLQKLFGSVILIISIAIVWIPLFLIQIGSWWIVNNNFFLSWKEYTLYNIIIYSLISAFVFKWSFALKNLGDVSKPIIQGIKNEDLPSARHHLSFIVRRDTTSLDKVHIISATVECIAESSTDSITSVFWFYLIGNIFAALMVKIFHVSSAWLLLLGLPLAYMYRMINTADSIVGYKNPKFRNIGWFSARMDDIANYIPARLTAFFILCAGFLLRKDIKNALRVLKNERNSLESVNAGWTMGAMAGLLGVQLEKIGKYVLGTPKKSLEISDIEESYKIIKLTSYMFILFLTIVCYFVLYLIRGF